MNRAADVGCWRRLQSKLLRSALDVEGMGSGEESTFRLELATRTLGLFTGEWDSTQGQMRKSARHGAANWMALAGQPERRKLELDGWPADQWAHPRSRTKILYALTCGCLSGAWCFTKLKFRKAQKSYSSL